MKHIKDFTAQELTNMYMNCEKVQAIVDLEIIQHDIVSARGRTEQRFKLEAQDLLFIEEWGE